MFQKYLVAFRFRDSRPLGSHILAQVPLYLAFKTIAPETHEQFRTESHLVAVLLLSGKYDRCCTIDKDAHK